MEWEKLKGSKEITQTEINDLNKKLGFEIPEAYSDFITKNNCVAPFKNYFFFDLNNKERAFVRFKYFLGINDIKFIFDIYSRYLNIKDRVPQYLFPIADTGGESIICMGYNGENKGKIFSCELGDVVNKVSYEDGTVYKVAESLDEVLNNLVEEPE